MNRGGDRGPHRRGGRDAAAAARQARGRRGGYADRHDEDRLRLHARAVPPYRAARLGRAGGSGRLRRRLPGQRALPPVDPAAGPVRIRVVLHGRARPAHDAAVRHRGHVPRLPLPPGGDRPRRRDAGRHVPRPLLARPRRGRGAQRARHRRRVAGGRRAQPDDVRVDRDHQQALQRQGRQARRRLLHARVRPPLHAPRGAGPDLRRHRRAGERQEDRQVRRRDHHRRRGGREDRDAVGQVPRGRRARPARTPRR